MDNNRQIGTEDQQSLKLMHHYPAQSSSVFCSTFGIEWNDDILNLCLWLPSIQQSNFINELQLLLLLAGCSSVKHGKERRNRRTNWRC